MEDEQPRSTAELQEQLQEYRAQREAVTELLSTEPHNAEYVQMAVALDEVLQLTQELLEGAQAQAAPGATEEGAADGGTGVAETTKEAAAAGQAATTLHDAARVGDTHSITQLLAGGADVNGKDRLKRAPIHLAAWAGRVDTIEYLVGCGAMVKIEAADGITPLHFACMKGHVGAAKALLKAGANISAVSSKGLTPLHMAVQSGSSQLVQWLLHKRADASAMTKQKKTAYDMAKTEQMRALLQEGAAAAAAEAAKLAADRAAKRADKAAHGDTSVSERRAKARVKTQVELEQVELPGQGAAEGEQAPSAAGGQGKKRKKISVVPAHLAADDDDLQDDF